MMDYNIVITFSKKHHISYVMCDKIRHRSMLERCSIESSDRSAAVQWMGFSVGIIISKGSGMGSRIVLSPPRA